MNILDNLNTPVKSIDVAPAKQEVVPNVEYKPDVFDKVSEKIINNRDITDTVTMPRAIFKGYLCFTAGTAINAIGGMLKNEKASKGLAIAGNLISILGTFNFVKPFLIKDKNSNETGK